MCALQVEWVVVPEPDYEAELDLQRSWQEYTAPVDLARYSWARIKLAATLGTEQLIIQISRGYYIHTQLHVLTKHVE